MSSRRVRSGGRVRGTTLSRWKRSARNAPEATARRRSRPAAQTKRTSTSRVRVPPTRSNFRSSTTRRSLACSPRLRSSIWSKNTVPPAAISILPALAWRASVKAPRSWPNSSDSSRSSGIDGQWTFTSGPSRRELL